MTQLPADALILIGYRGTGKSTVAQLLARRLAWEWKDADEVVEHQAGQTIAEIFAQHGEAAFRDHETRVLTELLQHKHVVLAAGGGAVLRPENRQRMRAAGTVVWLRADPLTIAKRVAQDATTTARRPDLTVQGGLPEIIQLLAERTPLYQACADLQIDTVGKSTTVVADEILAQWTAGKSILPSSESG